MDRKFTVECRAEISPVVESAHRILKRTVAERCGGGATIMAGQPVRVLLDIDPGIGREGFAIEDARIGDEAAVRIRGNDERGLLYGVGKFLRASEFEDGRFTPGDWRGVSVPEKPVRAMYFASHFHNFYHDAPLELVERYVEELALWGCNALSVWFDMHHYTGIQTPEAQAMIARLSAVLKAANRVGMGAGLTTLANEGYADSPEALRADWRADQNGYHHAPGGHYHVELCPYKPGGLEQIVQWRREMLEAFRGIHFDYVWIWPYDQGGCTCAHCAPWGANGFLKTAKAVAPVIRECCPGTKIVLSTWYFDRFTDGEWEGLAQALGDTPPDWVDCLMADDFGGFPDYPLQHGIPGSLPVVGFPEISMERMWPWGGFGANPRPAYWQAYWDKAGGLLQGSFPYSEGIFEDMNKAMILQLEWAPARTTTDIVHEYAAAEYGPAAADRVVEAVALMEASQNHRLDGDLAQKMWARVEHEGDAASIHEATTLDTLPSAIYRLADVKDGARCRALLDEVLQTLPRHARDSWRWRILWLRAALDAELEASNGKPTDRTEAYFDELTEIYCAGQAQPAVAPPSISALKRLLGA